MILTGRNAIGVIMGNGLLGREDGDPADIRFIINLVIRYRNKSVQIISSDGKLKTTEDGLLVFGGANNVIGMVKNMMRGESKN
jgi:hypothetical protein